MPPSRANQASVEVERLKTANGLLMAICREHDLADKVELGLRAVGLTPAECVATTELLRQELSSVKTELGHAKLTIQDQHDRIRILTEPKVAS